MVVFQSRVRAKVDGSFADFVEPIAQFIEKLQRNTGLENGGAEIIPYLGTRLMVPALTDNDATCAAAGEWKWGSGKTLRSFLFITLGTGLGGGLVLDGKLYRGSQGFAGEVGHIGLDRNGLWCECGSRGCFEQYASATTILRLFKEKRQKRGLPVRDSLTPKSVFDAANAGDPLALETIREAAQAIAQVFCAVSNLLNLEACIIGGAELQNDAGLLGAAAMAWERLEANSAPH